MTTAVTVTDSTITDVSEKYLDGADEGTYSAYAATREPQHVIYSVSGLTPGTRTIEIVKDSGTYLLVDRFDISQYSWIVRSRWW